MVFLNSIFQTRSIAEEVVLYQ